MQSPEEGRAADEIESQTSRRRKMFTPKKSRRTRSQSEDEEEEDDGEDGEEEDRLLAASLNAESGEEEEEEELEEGGMKAPVAEGEGQFVLAVEGEPGVVGKGRRDDWKLNWGIKCNICKGMYASRQVFEDHYRDAHGGKKPVYQCSYCSKCMDHYSTFRSHRYRHITEGRFRCEQCKKGFSVRSLLRVHILSKHAEVKPYICESCGRGFGTRPGLNLHLEKHRSPTNGRQWPCELCGKVLLTSSGHKAHLAVHQQGKRFMCELCGKTFTQKVNMQQHLKGHSGEKPFICDICGKGFAEKSHLNRHHSFHSDARPFRCEVCHKMYKTERCLKVHAMTHAEERPCVCSYCGKGFLSNNKLKQHYNIHTGERPYSCKFCERTFTNYPNYLKHTRRRHKLEMAQLGVTPAILINMPSQQQLLQPPPQLQLSSNQSLTEAAIQQTSLVHHQLNSRGISITLNTPHGSMVPNPYIKYEPHDSIEMSPLERDPLELAEDAKYNMGTNDVVITPSMQHQVNPYHQYQEHFQMPSNMLPL